MTTPRASSTEQIPPLQVALIAFLGLVFVFCVFRTVSALRGRASTTTARAGAASPSPTPAVPASPSPSAESEASPSPSPTPDEPLTAEEPDNAGAAIIAGELPPEFAEGSEEEVAAAPEPTPTPRRVRPKPVDVAPTPTPPVIDVEPSPPPPPADAAPAPMPTTVSLRGRITRPGAAGVVPLRNHALFLLNMRDMQMQEAATDFDGRFLFEAVEPGGFYYVIALFDEELHMGRHMEYQAGSGPAGIGWGTAEVPTVVRTQLSWHHAVDAPQTAGVYGLELDPGNADPEYCGDLRPTYDPVTRTPFRSWRRSYVQPL